MKLARKCIATKALLLLASLLTAASALAAEIAGTVTHLSGPLLAKKADGTVKVLSQKSAVEQGDTLISEKDTYARIKFVDNSEITLRPNSQMKIDSFVFDEAKPEKDSAAFNLLKGGLRAVTGMLGKRNKEKFGMNTPTATIGIRGTTFIAHYVPSPSPSATSPASSAAPPSPPPPPAPPMAQPLPSAGSAAPVPPPPLPPGLHLQVTDGAIIVTNSGGALGFQAGQFGYVPSVNQPPVIVPSNPNLQLVPPPSFSTSSGPQAGGTDAGAAVDCVVR